MSWTDIKKISSKAWKKQVMKCNGLLYDLLWRVSLHVSVLKLNKNLLANGNLSKKIQESMKCSMLWTDTFLLSTFYYSIFYSYFNHILTAWTCLILSITDLSHINWLPYQIPDISFKPNSWEKWKFMLHKK